MWANEYSTKTIFMGKGDNDADLLEQINSFCREKNIQTGMVNAIGAIKNLKLGYYKQVEKEYVIQDDLSDKGPFEIIQCTGNVSLKDGQPFCHLHIVAADREGNCFGGHLMPGVKVFALEFVIHSFEGGDPLVRGIDEETELPLWVRP